MSLFGQLDVESAEDNPWVKPDGTYVCSLNSVSVKPTNKGDKVGMTLEFKIQEGAKKGRNIKPWYWIPTPDQVKSSDEEFAEKAATAVSVLKMTVKNMGVPDDKINSLDAQDLMDMDHLYDVTIQTRNGSENVRSIAIHDMDSDNSNPFGG